MDVLNRKLFANRDARQKLADMGGIMASSPELMVAAQGYAPGGQVQAQEFIVNIPGLTAPGEYLRISEKTLMMLNDAIPQLMSQKETLVQPAQMIENYIDARPGDALVGTRLRDMSGQGRPSDQGLGVNEAMRNILQPVGKSIREGLASSYEATPDLSGLITPDEENPMVQMVESSLQRAGVDPNAPMITAPEKGPLAYGDIKPGQGYGLEIFGEGNVFTAGQPRPTAPEPTAMSETEKLRRQYRPSQGERPTDIDFADPTMSGLPPAPGVAQRPVTEAPVQPSPAMTEADAQMQAYAESLVDPAMVAEMQAINQGAKDFGSWLVSPKESSGLVSTEEVADKISEVVGDKEEPTAPTLTEDAGEAVTQKMDADADLTTKLTEEATNPDATPTKRNNSVAKTVQSSLGLVKPDADLSSKDAVKNYEKMFKEMLGESDEDAAKEMWHNMAMIGFAIAAGESPDALKNIANGLLEGSKMMKEDRAAKKKREDTITMLAIEAGLEDKRSAEQFARDVKLAGMKGSGSSAFEKMPTLTEAIDDAAKAEMTSAASSGQILSYADAVSRVTPAVRQLYGVGAAAPTDGGGADPNREAIGNSLGL